MSNKTASKKPKSKSRWGSAPKKPERSGFENIMTGDYFVATIVDQEMIDSTAFYVLKMEAPSRIVKMAINSIKQVPIRGESDGKR